MNLLLIGLRSAVLLLYAAMLFAYVRGKVPQSIGDRLGAYGWIAICAGVVIFSSPAHLAMLLGYSPQPTIRDLSAAGTMVSLLAGSVLWAAARGYRRGGTTRSVKIGLWINLTVIAACILAAYLL